MAVQCETRSNIASIEDLEHDLEELLEQVRAQRLQVQRLRDGANRDRPDNAVHADICPSPVHSRNIPPTTLSAFHTHNSTLPMTALAATGHQSITEMTSRLQAIMAAEHLQMQVNRQVEEASQSLFAACNANLTARGFPPMTITDFEDFRDYLSMDTESAGQQMGWSAHEHVNDYLGWVSLDRPFDHQTKMDRIFERISDGRMDAPFGELSADGFFGVAHLRSAGMLFKPAKQISIYDGFSYAAPRLGPAFGQ